MKNFYRHFCGKYFSLIKLMNVNAVRTSLLIIVNYFTIDDVFLLDMLVVVFIDDGN